LLLSKRKRALRALQEGKWPGQHGALQAKIGDYAIIEKFVPGYLAHVGVQADSDRVHKQSP
jgi:hypothetical protein